MMDLHLTKQQRLDKANEVIRIVSSVGRRFFDHTNHGKSISRFELDHRGVVWYIDGYSEKRVYVMYQRGRWRGFTEGGTLRSLIENLRDYIRKGEPIRRHFGPWPETLCDGDLWGYGKEAMDIVRTKLEPLLTTPPAGAVPKEKL